MRLLSTLFLMGLLVSACGEKKEKATTDEAVETEMAEMESEAEDTMVTKLL